MCFTIHDKHPKEKTAQKDIVCWKTMRKIAPRLFESEYQYYRWDFTNKEILSIKGKIKPNQQYGTISRGIHSYSSKRRAISEEYWRVITIRLIIPKGSKYYYNPYDKEYVSDTIKLPKTRIK